jgi:hypothetical protein
MKLRRSLTLDPKSSEESNAPKGALVLIDVEERASDWCRQRAASVVE